MKRHVAIPSTEALPEVSDQERVRLLTLGFLEVSGGIPDPRDEQDIASLHDVVATEVSTVDDDIIRQTVTEAREAWFEARKQA